jgi:hypothetical protein
VLNNFLKNIPILQGTGTSFVGPDPEPDPVKKFWLWKKIPDPDP